MFVSSATAPSSTPPCCSFAFGPSEEFPSLSAVGALFGLKVGGIRIAYLLCFGLLARVGATRTSAVAYLMPSPRFSLGPCSWTRRSPCALWWSSP